MQYTSWKSPFHRCSTATLGAPLEATLLLAAAARLAQVLELTALRRRCIEEAPAALQQAAAAAAVKGQQEECWDRAQALLLVAAIAATLTGMLGITPGGSRRRGATETKAAILVRS